MHSPDPTVLSELDALVDRKVAETPVFDIHTHLYDAKFGPLLLWGVDELLIYHYLVAETFRYEEMPFEDFWKLSKTEQANLAWKHLFLENSPVSEACRGVLTTLNHLGLNVSARDLPELRKWFSSQNVDDYITLCMEKAGVSKICMTNWPFDPAEATLWNEGFDRDQRFVSALRIDPLLVDWPNTWSKVKDMGYDVTEALSQKTISELRRFLADWTRKMDALYVMVSISPGFEFPAADTCAQIIEKAVLPHCEEFNIPLAMMPGVRRQINPHIRLAGDGVGRVDLEPYQNMISMYPKNKFLLTVLSRENQHELCVLARKFRNLHVFGCWWFLNNPVIIEDMTRMRMELIGLSMTPQHSDARVLDQIIYKWNHSRAIIGKVLKDKYRDIAVSGWVPTEAEVQRDVKNLFGGAFETFLERKF